ncbi:MAG: AraC family ligand binding domain-containing protein [Bacilli bacterium]
MNQEQRTICFDETLGIEAYHFKGIMQKFPNHFHDYYVIGYIEDGNRYLSCKNRYYNIGAGDLILFNPMENHTCAQIDARALDYRCLNVTTEVMQKTVLEMTGRSFLPTFTSTVLYRSPLVTALRDVHQMIMNGQCDFQKEEAYYFLIQQLLEHHCDGTGLVAPTMSSPIQEACAYMDEHFAEMIRLDDLSQMTGLNKYTLLRQFTRQMGVTPYQYLETIRIGYAKKLLEQGVAPIEAALQSGFTDQSHFTRFFKNFIGLTPKQYQAVFAGRDE